MRKQENAYLTVYLALCITLILSLCLALIEGARRNGARLETEIAAEIGLQSVLAEYHRELFNQYNLFAVDSSYGTNLPGKINTEKHLEYYLKKNLDLKDVFLGSLFYRDFFALYAKKVSLERVSVLTDEKGAVFRKCAAEAVKDDIGLNLLVQLQNWMQVIEINGLEERDVEGEKDRLDYEIQEYDGMEIDIGEEEPYIFHISNPTTRLEEQRKKGILKLVLDENSELSAGVFRTEGSVTDRMEQGQTNQGNIALKPLSEADRLWERFLFQEYLLRYMGHYGKVDEEDGLKYQIEYLVSDGNSDAENLRSVLNRICAIREAANTLHLLSDTEKRGEAELAAALVCDLAMVPEVAPVLEAAIILGWAFAESIYDVKTLIAGGSVPLLKDTESWHYSLENALSGKLNEREETENEKTYENEEFYEIREFHENGEFYEIEEFHESEKFHKNDLTYEDYLRIFMMCTDLDALTARAMNMVEADIRMTSGNGAFRLDGCYAGLEAYIEVESRHGFQFEITRKKFYFPQ